MREEVGGVSGFDAEYSFLYLLMLHSINIHKDV